MSLEYETGRVHQSDIETINYGPTPESIGMGSEEVKVALKHTSSIEEARDFVGRYRDSLRQNLQVSIEYNERQLYELTQQLTKRHLIELIYTLGPATSKPFHPSFRSVSYLAEAMEELLPTDISFYHEPFSYEESRNDDEPKMSKQNQRYLEIVAQLNLRGPQSNGRKVA